MIILKKHLPGLWHKNKSFLFLVLQLLLVSSFLKVIFYLYNSQVLAGNSGGETISHNIFLLAGWSVMYDCITIILINFPLLLLLNLVSFLKSPFVKKIITGIFLIVNAFMLLLNGMDIFYFKFYHQRSNADLLFVLDHPLQKFIHLPLLIIAATIIFIFVIGYITSRIISRFYSDFKNGSSARATALIIALVLIAGVFNTRFTKKILVPAYPLININSTELQLVQNSFHTFSYSLLSNSTYLVPKKYFTADVCDSLFPIKKQFVTNNTNSRPKNIVLFIMESVPVEFFDTASRYKVAMPFFDSLVKKSTFFSNAYSYAYESNKGIVSILAATPTLTDVPLYHSSYNTLPVTHIGKVLQNHNYHSFFCIGDHFDDFGFAKCIYWLGLDKYFSKTDIPGYQNMEEHTMGIHDEYVLDFMFKKINEIQKPFFAVNYNISTHYPNDLPKTFHPNFPAGYSGAMKSMVYYDACLHQFFDRAKKEQWFNNTLFIFCSDHWALPNGDSLVYTNLSSFKIPMILYDPSVGVQKTDSSLVSQFDILGTIFSATGMKDSAISYGNNLLDDSSVKKDQFVFNRINSSLYQVIDPSYILGYNSTTEKPVYLYQYKRDGGLKDNLVEDEKYYQKKHELSDKIKAFIQKCTMQYFNEPFR